MRVNPGNNSANNSIMPYCIEKHEAHGLTLTILVTIRGRHPPSSETPSPRKIVALLCFATL